MDSGTFDSTANDAVVAGHCVMIDGHEIVYAGPFKTAPDPTGKFVLLNSADFNRLKSVVDKSKH